MSERVVVRREAGVAVVTLSRPDKLNALDPAMFEAIAAAGEGPKADTGVRAVVLHGAGPHFCAGLDMASFQSSLMDNAAFRSRAFALGSGEIANQFQKPMHVWKELAVPVIAAINGVAYGGGFQIALGADIRIAAPDARLSVMEIRWGLVPDMGLMTALPRLVRMDVAKDLVLSGRIVAADEALAIGLVTRIAEDPLGAALEEAHAIAARSPDAIRGTKALLERAWAVPPAEALRLEAEIQAGVLGHPNQTEAVQANLQKRSPLFSDTRSDVPSAQDAD